MLAPYVSDQKRSHLVRAAKQLIHEQGLERTTFAHVAARADVPLGNVYYYFKTKEALAESAIASHEADLRVAFAAWTAAHREPRARLRRFVRGPLHYAEDVIKFGCPHGSLCQKLEKLAAKESLAKAARRLLSAYIDCADGHVRAHGFRQG